MLNLSEVFDKVLLLYKGRQIFFGDARTAKDYFTNLGFVCADRATAADFLTSLTKPAERVVKEGYALQVPRTPEEFAAVWHASDERIALLQEISDCVKNFASG